MAAFGAPITVGAAIRAAMAALDGARIEAHILVSHAAQLNQTETIAHPERPLSAAAHARLAQLIERRQRGEPIAYLTGRREFWSLDLAVTPDTLIPRHETELLVERALLHLPATEECSVVDLGTGSGAIALAIARERPRAKILATDRSEAALAVARGNAARLGILNVEFLLSDWFQALAGRRFDVVVSNPPYLREQDAHLHQGDVRFEPRDALVAGADGLTALRQISGAACAHLNPNGRLVLEHGFDQAAQVQTLLGNDGYRTITSYLDLAGHTRVTEAYAP